jgi:hypothetical protein
MLRRPVGRRHVATGIACRVPIASVVVTEDDRGKLARTAPSPEKRYLLGHAARGFFAMDQYPHPPMDTGVDPINRPGAVLITLYRVAARSKWLDGPWGTLLTGYSKAASR